MSQPTKRGGTAAPGVSGLGSKKPSPRGRAREKARKTADAPLSGSVFIELGKAEFEGGEDTLEFERLKKIRRLLEQRSEPLPLTDLVREVGGDSPKERERIRATVQDLIGKGVLTRTG